MLEARSAPLLRYGFAVLVVGLATLLIMLVQSVTSQGPFVLFLAAVTVAAWYGGVGPGLLATLLAVLIGNIVFLAPAFVSLSVDALVRTGVFLIAALLVNILTHSRWRAMEALRQERERFEVTLASIGDAVIATDVHGRVTFLNAVGVGLTGWDQKQAAGEDVVSVFHIVNANTRQPVENPVARVLREGLVVGLANHTILIARDGKEIPIDDSAAPIHNSEGKAIGTVLVFRDVSERQQAENALRQSEERFSKAFHNTPVSTSISRGSDGSFIDVNDAFLHLLGYTRDEVIGHTSLELGIWPERMQRDRVGQMLATQGWVRDVELPFQTKSGETRIGLLSVAMIEVNGEPCVLSISNDITARKRAEAERDHLLVREQAARALAEEAVRDRETFLSIASHELRTPLTALLAQAELMERRAARADNVSEPDRRAIQVVIAQGRRLDRLVAALLDVSRIQTGQLSIQRVPLDLCELARRVVAEVQPTTDKHMLRCETPDGKLVVEGDELRLEQVLQNLIGNAVKYSPSGGDVLVRVEREGEQACFRVSDQGIGIPKEAQPQLFQRFYRATNTDGRSISGMGVGLYVVKEIVTLHGGTVAVDSTEGAGSTFTVCLPLQI